MTYCFRDRFRGGPRGPDLLSHLCIFFRSVFNAWLFKLQQFYVSLCLKWKDLDTEDKVLCPAYIDDSDNDDDDDVSRKCQNTVFLLAHEFLQTQNAPKPVFGRGPKLPRHPCSSFPPPRFGRLDVAPLGASLPCVRASRSPRLRRLTSNLVWTSPFRKSWIRSCVFLLLVFVTTLVT